MSALAQKYVRAAESTNLRNDELHHDLEVIMAVALASTWGGLMFRVKYQNDRASYRRLLDQWTWIVSCKAVRRQWPNHIDIKKVAYLSLQRWLNSICPACTGRKKQSVFNTPMLSDRDCPLCQGTGEAPFSPPKQIENEVLDMVEELFDDEFRAARRAKKKLGRE